MLELWTHQKRAIGQLYSLIRKGTKRVIVASSTGSGKTIMFSQITKDVVSRGKKVLIIVDDSPLISQTVEKLGYFDLTCGVIKSGVKPNYSLPIQVASIDTLIRRDFPEADVVIFDECHLSYSKKYRKVFEFYGERILIGFTATPERTSKRESLTQDWEAMVKGLTIQEAIAEGVNAPFVVYALKRDTLGLKKIKTSHGEYKVDQLSLEMRSPKIMQLAVDQWKGKADGKMTIGFGVDLKHIDDLCRIFNENGIAAETIDGRDTDEKVRQEKYRKLREREIQVLFSVNVLILGFDEKQIECVLCCRPTKSKILWVQMVGRALRVSEGKGEVVILDQAENTWLVQHPLSYVPDDLNSPVTKEKQEAPTKECPECGAAVLSFLMKCPHCGHVFPPKPKAETHEDLQIASARVTNPVLLEQKKLYAGLLKSAMAKNYSPGWAAFQFNAILGRFPASVHKLHALYGSSPSKGQVAEFYEYLKNHEKRKERPQGWLVQQLHSEFGSIDINKFLKFKDEPNRTVGSPGKN
jgi:superfamily II DNA or RNA helicase